MKFRNLIIPIFILIGFTGSNSSALAQNISTEENLEKVPENRLLPRCQLRNDSFISFHKPQNNYTVTSQRGGDINSRLYAVSYSTDEEGITIPVDSLRLFWNGDNYDPSLPIQFVNDFLYYPDNSTNLPTAENAYIIKTDSMKYYSWESGSELFQSDSKVLMSFDDLGNVITETELFTMDGINYENYLRTLFTYSGDEYPASETQQQWTGTTWENYIKRENTYDSQNNLLEVIRSDWENSTTEWILSYKFIFSYNDVNKLDSYIILNRNTTNNSWQNNSRFSILYEGDNLTQVLHEAWNGIDSEWEALEKTERTFNTDNQLTNSKITYWNIENQMWINNSQYILAYDDNGNNISRIEQEWESGSWENSFKIEYFYSPLNLVEVIGYEWSGSEFAEDARILYIYNDYEQCTEAALEFWDGSDWSSDNTLQIKLYYEEFEDNTTGSEKIIDRNAFEIYPNPTSDVLRLKLNNRELQEIKIIDITGTAVFESSTGSYASEANIPVNHLRNGVYIIRVKSGNQIGTKSFVVKH